MQQLFLRWNQGQELRQALITIAIAIILADQMIAHFGAFTQDIAWPGVLDRRVPIHLAGVEYSVTRLFILAIAIAVGLGALPLAEEDADGDGHPRGRRRPSDGLRARGEHPAHVRDRLLRRLGARRPRRRDRRLVREPRPRGRRELAPLLARRRDHRRDGLARRRGRGLAPARPRVDVRGRLSARRATRTTRSSSRSCCSRSSSRSGRSDSSGGRHEAGDPSGTASSAAIGVAALVVRPGRAGAGLDADHVGVLRQLRSSRRRSSSASPRRASSSSRPTAGWSRSRRSRSSASRASRSATP